MTNEDINDWTQTMIEAKITELENSYEQLQTEYIRARSELINDIALLRHRIIVDDLIKKTKEHKNV